MIETVSPSFGRAFVTSTDAIWFISRGVIEAELVEATMMLLPVDTRDTSGPVGLTLRAESLPTPATRLLIQAIRDAALLLRGEAG